MSGGRGLSKVGRIIYSIGRMGSTALLTVVSLTSYNFYLKILSVDPIFNSLAHSMSKFLMAITGLLFGYLSDLFLIKRFGKRKMFILLGSIILSISFGMLYNPIVFVLNENKLLVVAYEFFWLTLIGMGYSALIIPYQALMPEITAPNERGEVSFYQNFFNIVGDGIGIGVSLYIFFLVKTNYQKFYLIMISLSIIEIMLYFPLLILINSHVKPIGSTNILREIKLVLRDRNFVLWEFSRGLSSAGTTIYVAMIIDFIYNYLNILTADYLLEWAFLVALVLVSIPTLFRLSKKFGMKNIMYYSLLILSISLISLSLYPLIKAKFFKIRFTFFLLALSLIGLIGYWIFNYAVTANIIDSNYLTTGVSRAGTYMGLDNINVNFFQSIGYMLLGISLKYLINLSELAWTIIAGLLILLSVLPLKFVVVEVKK